MAGGFAAKAGVKFGVAWASAWAAVDTLLTLKSENITAAWDLLQSKALIGQAAQHQPVHGTQMVKGDLVLELDFVNALSVLTYAIGGAVGDVITPANDLSANCFNLEIEKVTNRYRFQSCMISKATIAGSMGSGDPLTLTLSLIAYAGTTTASAFPSLNLASGHRRVYMEDLRHGSSYWRFGDCADALAVGDLQSCQSMELVIDDKLADSDKDSSSGYVLQPERTDFREVSVKIGVARFNTTTALFQTWAAADTMIQSALNVTDGTNSLLFQYPCMKVVDSPQFNVDGPGVLKGEATMRAWRNLDGVTRLNTYMAVDDQLQLTASALS